MNGSGPGTGEVRQPQRGAGGATLPRGIRATLYGVAALLWVSGAVWLVLHYVFPQSTTFGPVPNPWEAPLMRVHGPSPCAPCSSSAG